MRENRYIMLHNPVHYFKNLTGYIKDEFNELKEKIDAHPRAKNIIIYSVPPALLGSIGFIVGYNSPMVGQEFKSKELVNVTRLYCTLMSTLMGVTAGSGINVIISKVRQ